MSNAITITGMIGREPELRFTQGGKAVLGSSVADTPRRRNDQGGWEDAGETLWLEWSIWDGEAEAAANLIEKGSKVTITGRLKSRSYEAKDGTRRTVIELAADSIALHPKRDSGAQPWSGSGQARQAQPVQANDPWAGGATDANSEPPF